MFITEQYTVNYREKAVILSMTYPKNIGQLEESRFNRTLQTAYEVLQRSYLSDKQMEGTLKQEILKVWHGFPSMVVIGYDFKTIVQDYQDPEEPDFTPPSDHPLEGLETPLERPEDEYEGESTEEPVEELTEHPEA